MADWCGPCIAQMTYLTDNSEFLKEQKIQSAYVDKTPGVFPNDYIQSVPSIAIYDRGKLVKQIVGVEKKEDVINTIKKEYNI